MTGYEDGKPSEEPDKSIKRTAQHIGPTSDHDSLILRHGLREDFDESVDGMWIRWMRSSNASDPVCFVVSIDNDTLVKPFNLEKAFPDDHLDAHPSYYPRNVVERSVNPFRNELLAAYYEYVHPSFALLGPQTMSSIADSVSLRTSMYGLAQRHCAAARCLDPWLFTDFNKQALNIERHAPKLETVEAALLFAQRHAHILRAPAMPGLCAEVGSIVGMSHDLALNIDPTDWDISETEKRRRKRLWWGVYMQDKWSALTLGRPSYLHDGQSDVPMLLMADFAPEGFSEPSVAQIQPARILIGMATLSVILSKILDQFFTITALKSDRQPLATMQSMCAMFELQLEDWQLEHLNPVLGNKAFPDPTASKINFSIAGSFMVNMFLCSVSDEDSQYWEDQVMFYRKLLHAHSAGFEMTKHASIRLDLLVDRGNHKQSFSLRSSPRQPERNRLNEDKEITPETSPLFDLDQEWLSGRSCLSPSAIYDVQII
ncbi:hypothetical protein DV736_g6471, partial [Chaetothyriales sp. CBS 134916]